MQKKFVLGVITARGGSKGIKNKNLVDLGGKSLIAYAIEAAQKSKTVNRIIVSTDDGLINEVALSYGAEVPFKRPADISEDVPTEDVVLHAVEWLEIVEGYLPDIVVCLEPPVPFRKAEHIDQCVTAILADNTIDSAITVTNIRGMRPEWMVRVKDGLIEPYTDYFKKYGEALIKCQASQKFEPLFKTTGVVFSCRTTTLKKYKSMVGVKCAAVEVGNDVTFDLDYPEDFEICEFIMKRSQL